jgi:PAS domain S-box-containing protein
MIRIFLVDHALEHPRSLRNLLRTSLTSDFRVNCAVTYREILDGFHSREYDVCLIDSAAGNGPKLFAQARSLGCVAPIILVTSNDAGEAIGVLRNGVADCLIRDELTTAQIERSICSVVEQARGTSLQLERQRRYLGLLDNANEIIYTHNLDGNFTSMNRTGEQLLGFSHGEILNLNISQIVAAEYRGRFAKLLERTLDAQTQTFEELELMTKDGYHFRFEVGTHPIYHQGKPIEIQGVAANPRVLPALVPRALQSRSTYQPQSHSQTALAEMKTASSTTPSTLRVNFLCKNPRKNLVSRRSRIN